MTSLLLSAALTFGTAQATTYAEILDLDDLSSRADTVVRGEVIGTRAGVDDDGLHTIATVLVAETLRGTPSPSMEVRVPGGKLDDIELTITGAPKLQQGFEVLLFIDDSRVVGFGQGAFIVDSGQAWRPSGDMGLVSPRAFHEWTQRAEEHMVDMEDNDSDDLHASLVTVYPLDEVRRAVR